MGYIKYYCSGISKVGDYDIIFAGRQAIDGDTAQVGPQIAEKLDIPQVTYVQDFKIEGKDIIVQRQLEDGYELIKVSTPVLLTAVKELNTPRYMSVDKIVKAYKHDVKVWTIDDLDVNKEEVGLKASPTKVFRSFTPEPRGKGEILEGKADEIASKIIIGLKQKHII